MRIGFLAVPRPLYQPLLNLRSVITRQNSVFLQDAVARWMDNGGFERHMRRMRRVYQERRDTLVDTLTAARQAGLALDWTVPDGGMALWLDCGADADAIARNAADAGVFVTPESEYRCGPRGNNTHLRLGYASQSPEEIRAGAALLIKAIKKVARNKSASAPRKPDARRSNVYRG